MIATENTAARTVLLTRDRNDSETWARELNAHGIRSVVLPCISVEWFDTPQLGARLQQEAREKDWIVFTSRRGVQAFCRLTGSADDDTRALLDDTRIAAVGETTAAACKAMLGRVDLVSSQDVDRAVDKSRGENDGSGNSIAKARGGTAAALAQTLLGAAEIGPESRLLLVLADNAGTLLERRLRAAGAAVVRIAVYRTIPAPPRHPRQPLSSLGADNIFLASPSAVTGLVNQVAFDREAAVFTIGPSTSERAREAGLAVTREAREPSLDGLLEAMQWTT